MTKREKELLDKLENYNCELFKVLNERILLTKEAMSLNNRSIIKYFIPEYEHEMLRKINKNSENKVFSELIISLIKEISSSTFDYLNKKHEKKLLVCSPDNGFHKLESMFTLSQLTPILIAGPCAVESYDYMCKIAEIISTYGTHFLRGGAYKPRTSPYEFQGLGKAGLEILYQVGKKYNLITVTEVIDTRDVEAVAQYADVLQIGARNMQNYELLKEVGRIGNPVVLKRGISASMKEFILAAEYIAVQGNRKIVLCERGIRTFETKTRNTLDISCIPILKNETCLPVIVDLSHSLGRKDIINAIANAVIAAGADGIMVEVHPEPYMALSDANQQLNIDEFVSLLKMLNLIVV